MTPASSVCLWYMFIMLTLACLVCPPILLIVIPIWVKIWRNRRRRLRYEQEMRDLPLLEPR